MKDYPYEDSLISSFGVMLGYAAGVKAAIVHKERRVRQLDVPVIGMNSAQRTRVDTEWGDALANADACAALIEFKRHNSNERLQSEVAKGKPERVREQLKSHRKAVQRAHWLAFANDEGIPEVIRYVNLEDYLEKGRGGVRVRPLIDVAAGLASRKLGVGFDDLYAYLQALKQSEGDLPFFGYLVLVDSEGRLLVGTYSDFGRLIEGTGRLKQRVVDEPAATHRDQREETRARAVALTDPQVSEQIDQLASPEEQQRDEQSRKGRSI